MKGVPTLTGQLTLAVLPPASCTTSHSVATFRSRAYQYQPSWFCLSGSNTVFAVMPCKAGHTPVIRVV